MIDSLKIINFPLNTNVPEQLNGTVFVLKTCQRTLLVSLNHNLFILGQDIHISDEKQAKIIYTGSKAYQFILEIVCGLQSKVIAENEILGQFKEAYATYKRKKDRDPCLMSILERIIKDAKEIRSKHLLGINQKTYASLVKKKLMIKSLPSKGILILGSGHLALDIINQLKKHTPLYLSARNKMKIGEFIDQHHVRPISWRDFTLYKNFAYIVNTVGTNEILFDPPFFSSWLENFRTKRLFIDLGTPSIIDTKLGIEDGVIRLSEIYKEAQLKDKQKVCKIREAHQGIQEIMVKRTVIPFSQIKRV